MSGKQVLDEDELLMWTEGEESGDEMEHNGREVEQNVSEKFQVKDDERRIVRLRKQIAAIGITCEAELGKRMRIGDSCREEVMKAVKEQVDVAKELITATMKEILSRGAGKIDEEIVAILEAANIAKASELSHCLDTFMALKSKWCREVAALLSCKSDDVIDGIKDLIAENARLAKEIDEQQLQVEQLRRQVEDLGKGNSASKVNKASHAKSALKENFSGNTPSKYQRYAYLMGDENFELQGTSISTPLTRECCEHTPTGSYQSNRGTPSQQVTGTSASEVNEMSMGEYIRVMALPEVQPYSGRPGECFKRFVRAFCNKYPSSHWKESSRLQLFEGFLRKEALTVFETLPESVRESSVDEVVQAMKQRLRIDSASSRVKAMAELRSLTMRENQSVSEFCLALEKLASRAYPDVPIEVVSLQKAEILSRQLATWEGSYCLAEALEIHANADAYEKVKEAALRLERSREMTREMSGLQNTGKLRRNTVRQLQQPTRGNDRYLPQPEQEVQETECNVSPTHEVSEIPRSPRVSEHNSTTGRKRDEVKRCYNCGKLGHIAAECRMPPRQSQGRRQPPHSVQFRTSSRSKCIFRASVASRDYCTEAFADSPRTRYKCSFRDRSPGRA